MGRFVLDLRDLDVWVNIDTGGGRQLCNCASDAPGARRLGGAVALALGSGDTAYKAYKMVQDESRRGCERCVTAGAACEPMMVMGRRTCARCDDDDVQCPSTSVPEVSAEKAVPESSPEKAVPVVSPEKAVRREEGDSEDAVLFDLRPRKRLVLSAPPLVARDDLDRDGGDSPLLQRLLSSNDKRTVPVLDSNEMESCFPRLPPPDWSREPSSGGAQLFLSAAHPRDMLDPLLYPLWPPSPLAALPTLRLGWGEGAAKELRAAAIALLKRRRCEGGDLGDAESAYNVACSLLDGSVVAGSPVPADSLYEILLGHMKVVTEWLNHWDDARESFGT